MSLFRGMIDVHSPFSTTVTAGRKLNLKIPDVKTKYGPFRRQLLPFYWALVVIVPTTQGFQRILRPKVP